MKQAWAQEGTAEVATAPQSGASVLQVGEAPPPPPGVVVGELPPPLPPLLLGPEPPELPPPGGPEL